MATQSVAGHCQPEWASEIMMARIHSAVRAARTDGSVDTQAASHAAVSWRVRVSVLARSDLAAAGRIGCNLSVRRTTGGTGPGENADDAGDVIRVQVIVALGRRLYFALGPPACSMTCPGVKELSRQLFAGNDWT